jgi:hypothetical protein
MFCAPEPFFGGTQGVGSCIYVLRSRTQCRRYRGRQASFSCFALPDSFSAIPAASGPVFMFCAPGPIFVHAERVGCRFDVLRSRTLFRRYRGCWVLFLCFALPDSVSAVPRAADLVFMFCIPGLGFGGTEDVRFRFHVFRSRTSFWRYQRRLVPFSCFELPGSFSAVPRASCPVFMFCAPGPVLDGNKGVGSRFHVLRSRTHFRRYRGRRVPFSCFALVDPFFPLPRASGSVFMFFSPGPVFGGTDGVGYRFYVLRSRTRFRRYRGRRVPFSCFAFPDSFSAVPRAPGAVFMFFSLGHGFSGTEGVGSRFHVLRSRTRFRRYRRRPIPFSCFALPDPFSMVPTASGPVFMFYAPGPVFDGTEGVGSRFHVLRSRTRFRRYRRRLVPFSCFALPD